MAGHTPGPWIFWDGDIVPANDASDAIVAVYQDTKNEDVRLIAAAPDLLEACEEFVRKCENGEAKSTRSYSQMKTAIFKAKGGV